MDPVIATRENIDLYDADDFDYESLHNLALEVKATYAPLEFQIDPSELQWKIVYMLKNAKPKKEELIWGSGE